MAFNFETGSSGGGTFHPGKNEGVKFISVEKKQGLTPYLQFRFEKDGKILPITYFPVKEGMEYSNKLADDLIKKMVNIVSTLSGGNVTPEMWSAALGKPTAENAEDVNRLIFELDFVLENCNPSKGTPVEILLEWNKRGFLDLARWSPVMQKPGGNILIEAKYKTWLRTIKISTETPSSEAELIAGSAPVKTAGDLPF